MWNMIYGLVARMANWPVLALLFVIFLLCISGFEQRRKAIGDTLESSIWYTPDKASKVLQAMGEHGRNIYAITEITLDLIFPFLYGGLFAILLFHVYGREKAGWVLLIPLIAIVADLLENFTAAYLAWSFDGRPCQLAWAATTFTIVKTAMFLLSLVLILAGAVRLIVTTDNVSG
jgi:hypothetical protein